MFKNRKHIFDSTNWGKVRFTDKDLKIKFIDICIL